MTTLLIADDDPGILAALAERFTARGYEVTTAVDGAAALAAAAERPDVVLLDLQMPKLDGLAVLERLRAADETATVVVLTAHGSIERAVTAMKAGAYDFVEKPFDSERLEETIARAAERARLLRRDRARAAPPDRTDALGESPAMQELTKTAQKAARSDATILVTGESGCGKEVLARHLHAWSPRADEPLVAVHCAALPESLVESELFGHERGAFTGAERRHIGFVERAHRGTLFLDEIGELPATFQVKLLRVLQERTFERVGGREPIRVDTRIIAATNRDLRQEIDAGRFRDDLFYRLAVIQLSVPPLRDRRDDIVPLARRFLGEFAARAGTPANLDDGAARRLRAHDWPGNVRELRNVIERATALMDGATLTVDDLPPELVAAGEPPPAGFHASVDAHRRALLVDALARHDGNRTRAAEELGLQRTYLARLLKQYGIA